MKQDEFTLAINNPENEEIIIYEAQVRIGTALKAQQEIPNVKDGSVQKYVIYSKFPVQVRALPASHQPDNQEPKTAAGSELDEESTLFSELFFELITGCIFLAMAFSLLMWQYNCLRNILWLWFKIKDLLALFS